MFKKYSKKNKKYKGGSKRSTHNTGLKNQKTHRIEGTQSKGIANPLTAEVIIPPNNDDFVESNNLVAAALAPYSGEPYGFGYGSGNPLSKPASLVERPTSWMNWTHILEGRRQNRGNQQRAQNEEEETAEKKNKFEWVRGKNMELINAVGQNPNPPHLKAELNQPVSHEERPLAIDVRYRLRVSNELYQIDLVRRLVRAWEKIEISKFSIPVNIEIIRLLLQQYPNEEKLLADIKDFLESQSEEIGVSLIQALLPKASADNEPYLLQNSLFRVMDKRTLLGVCLGGNDEVWLPCVPSQASNFVTVTLHPLLGGRNGTIPSIQGVHILFAFIRFCHSTPEYDKLLYYATKVSEDALMRSLCQIHKDYVRAFRRSDDFQTVFNYKHDSFLKLIKGTSEHSVPPFYEYSESSDKIKCLLPEYVLFPAMAALQECVGDMFTKSQSALDLIKKGTFTDTNAAHDFKAELTVGKVVKVAKTYLEPLVFNGVNPKKLHFVFMTDRVLRTTARGDPAWCIELSMYKTKKHPEFTREFLFKVHQSYKPFTVDWLKTIGTFDTAMAVANISLPQNTIHAVNVLSFDPAPKARRNPKTDITVVDINMLATTDEMCLVAEYTQHSEVSVIINKRPNSLKKPSIINTLAAGVSKAGATPKPAKGAFASAGIVPIKELLLPKGATKLNSITTDKQLISLLKRIREAVPSLNKLLDLLELPFPHNKGSIVDKQRSRLKAKTYGEASAGLSNMTSNPRQNTKFRECLNRLLNLLTPDKHSPDLNICLNELSEIDLKILALDTDGKKSIKNRLMKEYNPTSGIVELGYFERVSIALTEFNNSFEELSSLISIESDLYENIKAICRQIVGTD